MKVCFHFENFDADVSSGTLHSMHQWYELLLALGVTEVAIINLTDFNIPYISSDITTNTYTSLEAFQAHQNYVASGNMTYVEKGGAAHNTYDYSSTDWFVFGPSAGLPEATVSIDTGLHALYPREAAAIILAAAKWQ